MVQNSHNLKNYISTARPLHKQGSKPMTNQRLSISFVTALILDTDLHKTREMEILRALSNRKNKTMLTAMISNAYFKIDDHGTKLIEIPIRSVPLISPLVWALFLSLYLPIHILRVKPNLVIMDPEISVVSSIPSCLMSRLIKTKFMLDVRGTPVERANLRGKLQEFMFILSLPIAKKLFSGMAFVSDSMKEEVHSQFQLKHNYLTVWTNGVPPDIFDPKKIEKESKELKKKLRLDDKFVVIYHGAFTASRGLAETLDAIDIVHKKYPQIIFLFLGSGPNLKDLINQKNLHAAVLLHDPVSYQSVPKFIGLSDVGIVPLPNTADWRFQNALNLLEYMAMEKVVLATDVSANRVVVHNDPCCIYIPEAKPEYIAKTIEFAYKNKEKLEEWGKSGRRIILNKYTWDKIAERIEKDFQIINSF